MIRPEPSRDQQVMSESPLVLSVVIACLNARDTLGEQLDALVGQVEPGDFEIIVADNGSVDGSQQLAESYRSQLPRLRAIDASRLPGPAHARNVGAEQAVGTWLLFCDADDVVDKGWVSAMRAALQTHDLVAGRVNAELLNDERTLRARSIDQQSGLQHWDCPPYLPHAAACNMGIRRDLFLSLGGFEVTARCLEDTDFSWRAQLAGATLTFVPDAVVHYRVRSKLNGIFGQGYQYGQATRWLELRYSGVGTVPEPMDTAKERARPKRSLLVAILGLLRETADRHSVAYLLWQFGWHLGHRRTPAGSEPDRHTA